MGLAVWCDLVVSRTHDLFASYAYWRLRLEHRCSFGAFAVPRRPLDLWRCDCLDLSFAGAPIHPLACPRSEIFGAGTAPDPSGRNAGAAVVVFRCGPGSNLACPAWVELASISGPRKLQAFGAWSDKIMGVSVSGCSDQKIDS